MDGAEDQPQPQQTDTPQFDPNAPYLWTNQAVSDLHTTMHSMNDLIIAQQQLQREQSQTLQRLLESVQQLQNPATSPPAPSIPPVVPPVITPVVSATISPDISTVPSSGISSVIPPATPSVIPTFIPPMTEPVRFQVPKFREPVMFSGKASDVESFISDVDDCLALQPYSFPFDKNRCIYFSRYLSETSAGNAQTVPKQWFRSLKRDSPHLLNSFPAFVNAFRKHFGDSNLAYTSLRKLEALKQTGPASNYAARFTELATYVDLNDSTKINMLYSGLKPKVKDYVSLYRREERPTQFAAYIAFVIDCDN
jgi:hypothetical protein